jgi:hypothetical protein
MGLVVANPRFYFGPNIGCYFYRDLQLSFNKKIHHQLFEQVIICIMTLPEFFIGTIVEFKQC